MALSVCPSCLLSHLYSFSGNQDLLPWHELTEVLWNLGEGTGGVERTTSGLCPSLPLQPLSPDHAWGSPNFLQVLPQRTRAHLRKGFCLVQHGLGGGLEGPGSLGDHALSRCDRLLQGLHLQAQGPGLGLLRLPGDGGLRQGLMGRSEGQVLYWVGEAQGQGPWGGRAARGP